MSSRVSLTVTTSSRPFFLTVDAFSLATTPASTFLDSITANAYAFSASVHVIPVAASNIKSRSSPSGFFSLALLQIPSSTSPSWSLPGRPKSRSTNSRSSSGGSTWRQPSTIRHRPLALPATSASLMARIRTGFESCRNRWKSASRTRASSGRALTASTASRGSLAPPPLPSAVFTRPRVADQAYRGRFVACATALSSASTRASSWLIRQSPACPERM